MVTQSKTFTAAESVLMREFPPPPDKRVTHDNQLLSPYTRWSFQNSLKLNCTAEVWRGNQPVAEMEYALRDLHNVSYQDWSGDWLTFDDMIELSYTDGIVGQRHNLWSLGLPPIPYPHPMAKNFTVHLPRSHLWQKH